MALEQHHLERPIEVAKKQEHKTKLALLQEQERVQQVQQSYRTIEAKSRQDNCDALLLPSVASTSPQLCTYTVYRDLAEKLRKEKRDMHRKMSEQCETIRDFWCNNLIEGCSRSGRMVRQTMLNKT